MGRVIAPLIQRCNSSVTTLSHVKLTTIEKSGQNRIFGCVDIKTNVLAEPE